MKNTPTHRVWDFLVLWPFIYFVLLFIFIPAITILSQEADIDAAVGSIIALMGIFFLLHMATIVAMIVVYVYAIHRLYTATKIPDEKKKMWLILVVVFNVFAIPFLHFMHLRK